MSMRSDKLKRSTTFKLIALIGMLVLLGGNYSCKKQKDVVPNVPVDVYIYVTDPLNIALNAVGGWVYVNAGVRGIILYRRTQEEFTALDRNCTYQPENTCATVYVDNTNIFAVDTCCGSKFQITSGSVVKGPATLPLKMYNASYDGTVVHIYN